MECTTDATNMHHYVADDDALPFRFHTASDYVSEVQRCVKRIKLTHAKAHALQAALWFDTRDGGNRGRCIKTQIDCIPELEKGDRLEMTVHVPDVHVDLRCLPVGRLHNILRMCFTVSNTQKVGAPRQRTQRGNNSLRTSLGPLWGSSGGLYRSSV